MRTTKRMSMTGTAMAGVAASLLVAGAARAQLAAGDPANLLTQADWITDLPAPTDLTFVADGRAVITLKSGEVVVASADGKTLKRAAGMFTVDTASEKGLLGVVRDDADNLYFYASTGPDNLNRHEVWKAKLGADNVITKDAKPLVSGGLEGPANHDGGGLVIYKGQLYISVGDTGFNATPPVNKYGACLNKPNGKILRVNLDGTIPADNPLSALAMVTGCATETGGMYELMPPDKRIYAWGLRNPWRFWIDPATDLLWIGDVGEATEEEVSVGGKGSNHGWPFNEGKLNFPAGLGGLKDCKEMTPPTDCVPPQESYNHNGDAASVTGGLIPPPGCGWGAFEQKYIYGDYNLNTLWTLNLAADRKSATAASKVKIADVGSPVSFRMGPDGGLYVVAHEVAKIVRIAPKAVPATCNVAAAPGVGAGGGADAGAGAGGAGGAAADAAAGAGGGGGGAAAGGAAAGGSVATGGTGGGGGDDGCSCNLGRARDGSGGGAGLAVGGLMLALAARSRKRRPGR
jgi:glucose/arabinose dehydrogenase